MDENPHCSEWVAYGECKNNPIYILGSPEIPGSCRKSWKVCYFFWMKILTKTASNDIPLGSVNCFTKLAKFQFVMWAVGLQRLELLTC